MAIHVRRLPWLSIDFKLLHAVACSNTVCVSSRVCACSIFLVLGLACVGPFAWFGWRTYDEGAYAYQVFAPRRRVVWLSRVVFAAMSARTIVSVSQLVVNSHAYAMPHACCTTRRRGLLPYRVPLCARFALTNAHMGTTTTALEVLFFVLGEVGARPNAVLWCHVRRW